MLVPVREYDLSLLDVDHHGVNAKFEIDGMILVEVRRSKGDPVLGGVASKIVLGQVGPVIGYRFVGAEHRDASGVALVAESFGGGVACCAAT
jgi:hypothetical protein